MASSNAAGQVLANALTQFSSHKCKVPQDRIYALLGLTGTSIQIDYKLSMIRLYTTVIIECVLEENLGTLIGEGKPLRITLRAWRNLINVLLNSCGLQPFHPTVALVTREALELCGISGHQDLSHFERYYSGQSVLRIIPSWLSDGTSNTPQWVQTLMSTAIPCWMRLRRLGTSLCLAYYRIRSNSLLTPCGEQAESFTYHEWVMVAEDIFYERMSWWRKQFMDEVVNMFRNGTGLFVPESSRYDVEVDERSRLLDGQNTTESNTAAGKVSKETDLDAALKELVKRKTGGLEWLERLGKR